MIPLAQVARIERLAALLARLPVLEHRRHTIRDEAENLLVMAGFAGLNNLPRAKKSGSAAAKRSLEGLIDLSLKLHTHISNMPGDAIQPLGDEIKAVRRAAEERFAGASPELASGVESSIASESIRHPFKLQRDLEKLAGGANRVLERLKSEPAHKAYGPRKPQAKIVTQSVAALFHRLTGKRPTRMSRLVNINKNLGGQQDGGAFVELLREVFTVIGIDARPAGQARLYREKSPIKKPCFVP